MVNFTISVGAQSRTRVRSATTAQRLNAMVQEKYATILNPAYVPGQTPPIPQTIPNPDPAGTFFDELLNWMEAQVIDWEQRNLDAVRPKPPVID
jgi:hypothetical protein